MADGGGVAKEAVESAGKVLRVGDGPEGCAVAVNNNLAAATDAVDDCEIVPAADSDGPNGFIG